MRLGVSAVTAVLLAALGAAPASASHSWAGYHWARTTNPFTVKLGDEVSNAWDGYLGTTGFAPAAAWNGFPGSAAGDWSLDRSPGAASTTAANPLNATVVAGLTTPRKCRAVGGRVEACDAYYGSNGWLGLASVWISGAHITQATVKLNDTYFSTSTYNTSVWRASVMCQEVGHAFGLDHQDTSGADLHTCMDYANSPGNDNGHPNQHDYDQLASIYGHLDSSTTLAAGATRTPSGGLKRVKETGRETLYVEDLGNGRRRLIWVVWRDSGAAHPAPPSGA